MYQNKYFKYKKKYLMAKQMTGGWKDTDVRSFAFWAYLNDDFYIEEPRENQWIVTNMIFSLSDKGTKDEYKTMSEKAEGWAIASIHSPKNILNYLEMLDKEIGTLDDPVEDEKLKKYISQQVLDFFKFWHKKKFNYKVFVGWQDIKTPTFGHEYISPSTKLKMLYDKYKHLLDEEKNSEFKKLMDEFKNVLPEYMKKDIEIGEKNLVLFKKEIDRLQKKIANIQEDINYANILIEKSIPNNYTKVWFDRLN